MTEGRSFPRFGRTALTDNHRFLLSGFLEQVKKPPAFPYPFNVSTDDFSIRIMGEILKNIALIYIDGVSVADDMLKNKPLGAPRTGKYPL